MIAEIGQICLILAVLLSGAQALSGFIGSRNNSMQLMNVAERSAVTGAILCVLAFICLAVTFANSDFSVQLVYLHSHTSVSYTHLTLPTTSRV